MDQEWANREVTVNRCKQMGSDGESRRILQAPKSSTCSKRTTPIGLLMKGECTHDFSHIHLLCELNSRQALNQKCQRYGAGDGDRTRDIQLGKLAFYR